MRKRQTETVKIEDVPKMGLDLFWSAEEAWAAYDKLQRSAA